MTVRIISRTIDCITFTYLGVPILIFFFGWFKLPYALLFSALLILGIVGYLRTSASQINNNPNFSLTKSSLGVLVIAFVWVYLSGIGGLANQDWDHHFRNALLVDLVQQKWPVYYSFPVGYKIGELANTTSALNYYFTYWLPAALLGTFWGTEAAQVSLFLWSYLGILLTLYYLARLFNFKYVIATAIFFMLWSCLDILRKIILEKHIPYPGEQIDVYYHYFYTSFTIDLYNTFNQAIPAWLLTLWVLNYRTEINIVPVVLLLAYAPFPFVGLALLHGLGYTITLFRAEKASIPNFIRALVRASVQTENIAILVGILLPYALFYSAHTNDVPSNFFWNRFPENSPIDSLKSLIAYCMTYSFEVGIYLLIIITCSQQMYRENKTAFWLCCVVLLLMPLLVVGQFGDFSSRGSIPFLTVLCVLMIKTLLAYYERKSVTPTAFLLPAIFLFSWITPVVSMVRGFPANGSPISREKIGSFSNPKITKQDDREQIYSSLMNVYSYNAKQHLFYKYLAKE